MSRFQEKKIGIITASDLKTVKGKTVYWSMIAVLIIATFIALLPSIWAVCTGFKDTQEIYSGAGFLPKNISWEIITSKITESAKVMDFGRTALNTLILSLGSVMFVLIIDGFGGYVISRLKPTGSRLVFALVLWTMMMPEQIRTVPLFISYLSFPFVAEVPGEVSLINTYWPMWMIAASSCFNVMLFKSHFDSISTSLIEAAKIDGCTNGKIFFKIMLPLSGPIILFVAINTMKTAWADFFNGYLIFNDERVFTMPVKVFLLSSERSIKMNTYMLCLVLSMFPMLVLFTLFNRYIVTGVNVGGVKG